MKNTIPLSILVEALECFRMLREEDASASIQHLTHQEYLRCLKAYTAFSVWVEDITKETSVEVTS